MPDGQVAIYGSGRLRCRGMSDLAISSADFLQPMERPTKLHPLTLIAFTVGLSEKEAKMEDIAGCLQRIQRDILKTAGCCNEY